LLSDEDDEISLTRKKTSGSTTGEQTKLTRLQGQVKDVIDDMKINIEKVVDRGNNLNDLNDRSEQLGAAGDLFSKRSRNLRKSMWLRTCRARMYLGITLSVIFILIICKQIYILKFCFRNLK
jgi:vesicle-associated membrane protein 4